MTGPRPDDLAAFVQLPMHILHLVSDEKFIGFIHDTFVDIPDTTHSYLVIVADASQSLRFLNQFQPKRVVDKRSLQRLRPEELPHDAIIIHYLDPLKMRAVKHLRTSAPIVWSGWGGDYYEAFTEFQQENLGPRSQVLQTRLAAQQTARMRAIHVLRQIWYQVRHRIPQRRFLDRIDYFSAPIPEDYDRILLHRPLRAKYQQINYGSVERTFGLGPSMAAGIDILVGNSSSISNNHLEVFDLLAAHDLGNRKIIVPLSYGSSAYRDSIIQVGQAMFGPRFVPLVDFMPLEQYNATIANCAIVIMGHRRQQAVGNIATMLYKGARVFLHERTTTYEFLKSRGACVSGLAELESDAASTILQPLTSQQQAMNAQVVRDFWNDAHVRDNAVQLVQQLRQHSSGH